MISLDQIRNLEHKVHAAVSRIRTLSSENATLKQRLESYEERIAELETLVSAFKADQEQIEAGIVAALSHLDELEDAVSEPDRSAPPVDETASPAPVGTTVSASAEAEAAPVAPDESQPDETSADPDDEETVPTEDEPDEATEEEDEPELDIF